MGYFQRYGPVKPGIGSQIDYTHPLGSGLITGMLFNEGVGIPNPITRNAFVGSTFPINTVWTSNKSGLAWLATGVNYSLQIMANVASCADMTIAMVIRPRATIGGGSYGRALALLNGDIDCYAPFIDGVVYWDFGGFNSPNRLTTSGLVFAQVPTTYIFTGGKKGSTIWQNGIK